MNVGVGEGKWTSASRAAYMILVGDIPDGMFVLHTCDNHDCCNPRHLYLGDQRRNMRDMVDRDRDTWGERSAKAKLTTEQVEAIRADTRSQRAIAAEYGVDPSTVCLIRTGKARKKG